MAAAIADNSKLSASNCLTMRKRLAPSASRTAISRVRATVRANCRFATFAQAMSKTNPTAPNKMASKP